MHAWLNFDIGLESWYIPEVRHWTCIAGFASWKQIASENLYWQGWQIRHFPDNSCMPGTRGCINSLKQWNHISYSSCNWSHHLVKFMKIYCYSPKIHMSLAQAKRQYEWGCNKNHHLCIFQVLEYDSNLSEIPPEKSYCYGFVIFLGRVSSSGFSLSFPNIIALTLHVREPMWRFCEWLSTSIPVMHSGTGKITQDGFRGPQSHCETDLS